MSKDDEIKELKLKMEELVGGIRKLSEKQNLQYTDIMMELKEIKGFIDNIQDANIDIRDEDELYDDAKKIVIDAGKASSSFLQRKLRIGYARAARLMDMLEDEKVIGPSKSSFHEVLIKE